MVNRLSTGSGETRLEKEFVLDSIPSFCSGDVSSTGVGVRLDFFLTLSDRVMKLLITDLGRFDFRLLVGLAQSCTFSACAGDKVGVSEVSWFDSVCETTFFDLEGIDDVDFCKEWLLFSEDKLISLPTLSASKLVDSPFTSLGDSPPSDDPEWVTEPAARDPTYDVNPSVWCAADPLSNSLVRLVLNTNLGDASPWVEQSSAIWRGLSSMSNSLSTVVYCGCKGIGNILYFISKIIFKSTYYVYRMV